MTRTSGSIGRCSWRLLSLAVAAGAAGCGIDTVAVNVEIGACDEQTAFVSLQSADVVLKRDDNAKWVGGCAQALGGTPNVDAFAALLARSFSFREVPVGGRWTLAVKGFSDDACGQTSVILCGRSANVALPPPGGTLSVAINCLPAYTDLEEYKACIRE